MTYAFVSMITEIRATETNISGIARMLDERGTVCIRELIRPEWLEAARADVMARLVRGGHSNQFVFDPAGVVGSPAHSIANDSAVRALMTGLAASRGGPASTSEPSIATAFNIVTASAGRRERPRFHYDACTVTMVVPLLMPDAKATMAGHLGMFPNHRPFRRSVVVNIAEKAIEQSRARSARALRVLRRNPDAHILAMESGNAYLFWGYRTYHGILPLNLGTVRATLLLHCGDPHGNSRMLKAARWLSRRVSPRPPQHMYVDSAHT